jgi:transcriptional regulator with XRE-family HTH domain
MSPFSTVLRELRASFGMRQAEFASKLGYEQSYVSAIEVGTKGPPNKEFIERVIAALELDEPWRQKLLEALNESQRKIVLSSDATEDTFKMFNELRRQIDQLHPGQVELIQMALRLPAIMKADNRIRHKRKEEQNSLNEG